MLEFHNLQLQANKHIFTKQNRKFIRFSHKNSLGKAKSPNNYINQSTITWDKPITFPQTYGQQIDFQIYEKHQFGYNPEQINKLLYGSIKINPGEKIVKFPVYSQADNNNKIGYIVINVRKAQLINTDIHGNSSQLAPSVIINSILIRKLSKKIDRGYVSVATSKSNFKTAVIQSISKQFLFLDKINLGNIDNSQVLNFQLHQPQDVQPVGKGKILFKTCKKSNRIDLFDHFGQMSGQLYFQIQDPHKKQYMQSSHKMRSSRSTPNIAQQLRTISDSRLSGHSQFLGATRRKRMSVVHGNTDIFAPSEKRFMIYQDKQTDIISYSKLADMKFQNPINHKSYKGASFGKGQKTDFRRQFKGNPGVGDYRLPSIFDRY